MAPRVLDFQGSRNSSTPGYRSGSRHSGTSSDDAFLRICTCGREAVIRTSWTSANPGRRFRGCPGNEGKYCRSFQWVDPPMCRRSREVIPGLLNRLSQYETFTKKAKERIEALEYSRRRSDRILMIALLGWILTFLAIMYFPRIA
ncbi:hypothetical protein Salat_0867200 [Sesamum alatum]|uniref:GRF-type domain-containing protein n=1 Tax=Sesamum alatum TaxID=300844 RepID=A0AAE1YJ64_9LAMI|nr:hypothetical protein Salat_0867200 [Sesamum alatum]